MKPKKITGAMVKNRREKKRSVIELFSINILMISFLSLIALGVWVNFYYPRPTALEMNKGRSAAFQSKDVEDPLQTPKPTETYEFNQPETQIKGLIPAGSEKIKVTFLYQCEPVCPQLWLSFQSSYPGIEWPSFLIYHPVLDNLDWFFTAENGLIFYQKVPTYKSINDLLQANPPGILTEKTVTGLSGWPMDGFTYLEDTQDLGEAKFIVTTHEPIGKLNGWYRFAVLMDTSMAVRDDNGQITFKVIQNTPNQPPSLIRIGKFSVYTQ